MIRAVWALTCDGCGIAHDAINSDPAVVRRDAAGDGWARIKIGKDERARWAHVRHAKTGQAARAIDLCSACAWKEAATTRPGADRGPANRGDRRPHRPGRSS